MSANSVIEKINKKAEQEAAKIWEDGKNRAFDIENSILNQSEKNKTDILYKAQKDCEAIMQTSKLNATLQARKNNLSDKQALITQVFEDVLTLLNKLDDSNLAKLINKLVLDECMSGNVKLVISKDNLSKYQTLFGKEYIKSWNDTLTKKYGISTTLSFVQGDFSQGGILFSGEKWDIDCRFDAIINTLKENYISDVSKILFE